MSFPLGRGSLIGAVTLLCLAVATPAQAGPVLPGFNSTTFLASDDGSYPAHGTGIGTPPGTPTPVDIGFTVNFYGNLNSQLFVNTNGNVTFGTYLSAYTPFGLTGALPVGVSGIIAPFFGDVDTRGTDGFGAGNGLVTFGNGTVNGHAAFGVNWPGVGYYNGHVDKLNNFQLVLIDRSDIRAGDFDIEFNYNQIQWETGDASGGSGGLGGQSAHVGFSNGSGMSGTNYELAGSGVNGAYLDSNPNGLSHTSNDGVTGQYLFQVRNGQPIVGVPEPGSLTLAGMGAAGLLGYGWRRKKRAV